MSDAAYPAARPRRLRQAPWVRNLVRETILTPSDLIWSVVVHGGDEAHIPVTPMPGVVRYSVEALAEAAKTAAGFGIPVIAIFPFIDGALKDAEGSAALDPQGLIPRAVAAVKAAAPEIGVMVDVALDPYTDHGHDGLLRGAEIVNDETVAQLVEQALLYVRAGADIVAPSDMMDGRVGAIRTRLEAEGFSNTLIMSYAAKYASAFYGPYRDAIGVKNLVGDKKTYQMDFGNSDEALREVALDLAEGADLIMVKPGLPYLDIVRRIVEAYNAPTFAFQISGEYAQIEAAAAKGWIDRDRAILETLTAFKRAGCAGIITYYAVEVARKLKGL